MTAVQDWLAYGLTGRDPRTIESYTIQCEVHIIPDLGARKLKELKAVEVEKWLKAKAETLSTRTVRLLHSTLNRIVKRAMVHQKVNRNVVEPCTIPTGQEDARHARSPSSKR